MGCIPREVLVPSRSSVEPSGKPVQIVGSYAVYDAIAAGGMATVHYGRLLGPVGFSRTIAIKRLHAQFARDPEFRSGFLDEARLAARVRHPNVVPTLDVVSTDDELFLVMEYVPGESLARLIRTAAGLGQIVPPEIVAAIMCDVLRGLHAAHEATNERGQPLGIVHRDVSPQNVLVGTDGHARVLDFGVAKAAGRLQTTREGQVKGKLAYMAPEQLRAKAVDRRTDVFAASVVLWEALTGRRLFGGNTQEDIVTQILEGRVETPSEAVSKEEADESSLAMIRALDAVTLKGLSLRADDRYDSAQVMAQAIPKALERIGRPAGIAAVGEWVEGFAKEALAKRAKEVAEIETISSVGPESMRAIRDNRVELADAATARAAGGSDPRSSARASDSSGVKSAPVDPAITSVAAPAARRTGRSIVLPLAAGGIGLALGFVLLGLSRTSPTGSIRSRHASISGALAQLAPPVTATPPLSDASEGAVAPSASVAPRPSAQAGHPRPTAPSARPRATSCDPPYSFDSQGIQHFKPECL